MSNKNFFNVYKLWGFYERLYIEGCMEFRFKVNLEI